MKRCHTGLLHSSPELLERLMRTASPHSGQFLAPAMWARLYPQRRHGLSRARFSETNILPTTMRTLSPKARSVETGASEWSLLGAEKGAHPSSPSPVRSRALPLVGTVPHSGQ